jgi:hypothetical protein
LVEEALTGKIIECFYRANFCRLASSRLLAGEHEQ